MKLVLLDRDGVLNRNRPEGIRTLEEFEVFSETGPAIKLLNDAGFKVAVVTNQSNVGRGVINEEMLKHIHEKLVTDINRVGARIDKIYFCPDLPEKPTFRRKPNPGMLMEAISHYQAKPQNTYMVGDSLIDLQAAAAAGCRRMLVRTGNGLETLEKGIPSELLPVGIFDTVLDAAEAVVKNI